MEVSRRCFSRPLNQTSYPVEQNNILGLRSQRGREACWPKPQAKWDSLFGPEPESLTISFLFDFATGWNAGART